MYEVLVVGDTEIDSVVCPPGDQLKLPPAIDGEAVSVAAELAQIVSLFTVIVGIGFTVTSAICVTTGQLPSV